MSTKTHILMVDDEPNVLSGYRRALGRKYDMTTAEGGRQALEIMRTHPPFPVIFTDMRMPGMDGVEFLLAAREVSRDSVYIMLTGNADQQTAIDAINRGHIFRFLNKPCEADAMTRTIEAAIRQYELIHAERVLLRDTLTGSVRLLVEAVMLSDPLLGDTITSIRRDVTAMCETLGVMADWRLPLAASLCLIGGLVNPDTEGRRVLSPDFLMSAAESGSNLLRHIPRLDEVGRIIAEQRVVGQLPESLDMTDAGRRVTIGAQILRYVVDFHRELTQTRGDVPEALLRLTTSEGGYDPRLIEAGERCLTIENHPQSSASLVTIRTDVRSLQAGMILDQDIMTSYNKMLLSKEYVLTPMMLERLKGFARAGLIEPNMRVRVDEACLKNIKSVA